MMTGAGLWVGTGLSPSIHRHSRNYQFYFQKSSTHAWWASLPLRNKTTEECTWSYGWVLKFLPIFSWGGDWTHRHCTHPRIRPATPTVRRQGVVGGRSLAAGPGRRHSCFCLLLPGCHGLGTFLFHHALPPCHVCLSPANCELKPWATIRLSSFKLCTAYFVPVT